MPTKVTPGSGAIFVPTFNENYGVSSINVLNGGSGYASTDPPKIEITGTKIPIAEGVFYPVISNGQIKKIVVLEPGIGYLPETSTTGERIGIKTTASVESSLIVRKGSGSNSYLSVASTDSSIIMAVEGGSGTALYENGYNVAISTTIIGTSATTTPDYSLNQNRFFGYFDPFPTYSTSGLGTGAKFSTFIVYNSSTGSAISTSLILREGGRGYAIGDTVSISGTFMNGTTPANDLSFTVSSVANTRIVSAANSSFLNIPSYSNTGFGTGARFNVSRNSLGDIFSVSVSYGGVGYALSDKIGISGTYIGGVTPADDLKLSPKILGTNKLPENLYITKLDDNNFKVSGLSTALELDLINYGLGTQSFELENSLESTIISIDNIIQSGLYKRDLKVSLASTVDISSNYIYVSEGISSITSFDIIQINSELLKVKNIGVGATNEIEVERKFMGSSVGYHTVGAAVTVLRGDFNIAKDVVYFSTPPYGPTGYPGNTVNSTFQGRVFSRQFDPGSPNDKNVIFDDISTQFVGSSSTEFYLKSNDSDVVGIYTDTNSVLVGGIDINNNPLVLINNVPQISNTDFVIDIPGKNRIKFLTGTPSAGKIVRTGISTGYGYQPLVAAGATVVVGNGLSESSYTSTFLNVGIADTVPQGMFFDPTGTKLFVIGQANDKVYQYNLSSPYNLTTAGLAASCPVGGEANPTAIFFKPDGTEFFYTGSTGDNIRRATLSTPWSLVGAANTAIVVPASTITSITGSSEATPTGLFIRPDGERVYLLGSSLDRVYQLTLTTGWDFSTINTGLSTSFLLNAVETGPTGIRFSPDGSRMYICGNTSAYNQTLGISTGQDRVHGFTLTTPWEVSTAVYNNETFLISQDTAPTDIEFDSSRTKMYILGDANNRIYEYNLREKGAIASISLRGTGSGYRSIPTINLISNVGSGASFTSTIGAGGTLSSISITNAGYGYTSSPNPIVVIGIPSAYSDLPLEYINGSSGNGTGAKASVVVGNQNNIIGFNMNDPGKYYKVGDVLKVVGIVTSPTVGAGFSEFRVTVEETLTDKFSGFYPGQFVQFDDISQFFTGSKRKFTLTVTDGGVTQLLSLKTDPSTDLKIENNLFVFVNDILQEPFVAYRFTGSRITLLEEAPKEGSKCTILFYRGSDLDVEEVTPPKTIKEGDAIQIGESILDITDREQFERIVKKIISTDSLDTFTYDSIGINTDPAKDRPLKWTKQTEDRIINGVLYSKSRPDLKSRIIPTTKLIKNVRAEDSEFYVDNAFPLFSGADIIVEDLRDVVIIESKDITPAISTAIVSSASTISSISLVSGGTGYNELSSPFVAISSSFITKKDPIYNWSPSTVGFSSNFNLKSVVFGTPMVAVGNSELVSTSIDGKSWNSGVLGYGQTVNLNSVGVGNTNRFVAAANNGRIFSSVGIGTSLSQWIEIRKLREDVVLGLPDPVISLSNYNSDFNDVHYSQAHDIWVVAGNNQGLFIGVGIGTTFFYEKTPAVFGNLRAVTSSNIRFVAVGDSASIVYSEDGNIWTKVKNLPSTRNFYDVIWTGNKFVLVGEQGTVFYSPSGSSWEKVVTNLLVNLVKVRFEYGFYTALDDSGELYFSFDLETWVKRSTNQLNKINDLVVIPPPLPPEIRTSEPVLSEDGRYILVGDNSTIIYSEPVYNRATATSSATSGVVTSITVTNPGFGYSQSNPPSVIIESDVTKTEKIRSIKAKGDFGIIKYVGVAASTISFVLQSEQYDNANLGIGYSSLNTYGITYSQLEVGDYFTIFDSNSIIGHALTGITTSLGGLSNYPESRVGTATSYLNGVYRVEFVSAPSSGIVTVRCNFTYGPNGIPIQVNTYTNENGIYGKYSWGKIYDYQNRTKFTPVDFYVNTQDGLTGLNTSPVVYRTRGLS
jgi:hypothetical protein